MDNNEQNLHKVSKSFGITSIKKNIEDLSELKGKIDVISLCSPTHLHEEHLTFLYKLGPKVIFCEKPLTPKLETSIEIVNKLANNNISLAVNYSRRWDPSMIELKKIIETQVNGKLRSITGIYNKGIINNGSHMLDLLNFLLGPIRLLECGELLFDHKQDDPSIPLLLKTQNNIPITLSISDARDYSHFECSFNFQNSQITLHDGGLYWSRRNKIKSNIFKDYSILDKPLFYDGRYLESMREALNNIYAHIHTADPLNSSSDSVLETQKLCSNILERTSISTRINEK